MKKTALVAALVSSAVLSAPAALALDWGHVINGAQTAAQGFMITDAQEVQMGQEISDDVLKETPALDHDGVQAYVRQVGARLAAAAKTGYRFQFTVIDSDEVNAFAAPGGFIFVTTGALKHMKSEAELAGVLGHEVAHVTKRHGLEAIKKAMLAQGALQAASGDQGALVQLGAKIGTELILKGFDRAAESESDEVGCQYAAAAGYDPKGIEDFLGTLGKMSANGPIWLMPVESHPRSDDRVKALATKRPATPKPLYVGKEAFQQRVLSALSAAGTD